MVLTKPYVIGSQPIVTRAKPGMAKWVRLAVRYSNGYLWSNGVYALRDIRSKPGVISNHARGVAVDLSYRHIKAEGLGRANGRVEAHAYLTKLLENANDLGIQLVIDYARQRSWRCDRGTWQAGIFDGSDWFHIEVEPALANNPVLVKARWLKVFGVSPLEATRPV